MEATIAVREPRPGDREIRVMDASGDSKLVWNPDNEFETEQARKMFAEHKKKRYLIYRSGADGSKGTVMHEFDPSAEKMIMVPPVVGG